MNKNVFAADHFWKLLKLGCSAFNIRNPLSVVLIAGFCDGPQMCKNETSQARSNKAEPVDHCG